MIFASWYGNILKESSNSQSQGVLQCQNEGDETIPICSYLHKESLEGYRKQELKMAVYCVLCGGQMDGDRNGGDRRLHVCLIILF